MNVMKMSVVSGASRLSTGTRELDRVLGGGFVDASTVLVSGPPGVGKTMLALQVAVDLANADVLEPVDGSGNYRESEPLVVAYVGTEETPEHLKLHTERLSLDAARLHVCRERDVVSIGQQLTEINADIVFIDSIHSLEGSLLDNVQYLSNFCKARGITCFLISPVFARNKTSCISNIVDVDIELHVKAASDVRLLCTKKNRFGSCDTGWLRATATGFESVESQLGR